MSRSRPFTRIALACLLLAAGIGAAGCSSRASSAKSADAPSQAAADAPAEPPAYPQPGLQAPSGPTSPPETETAEFDAAERDLLRALVGTHEVGSHPLTTDEKCSQVCKALGSMRRSAASICALEPGRCENVKGRLKKAEERASGACPVCEGPG